MPDSYVLVALPAANTRLPNHQDEGDDLHVTLAYVPCDPAMDEIGLIENAMVQVATELAMSTGKFQADVSGRGRLGDNDAGVLFMESDDLAEVHDRILANPYLQIDESFPNWVPHLTLGYGDAIDIEHFPVDIPPVVFDRIGVWGPDKKAVFPLSESIKFPRGWSHLAQSDNLITVPAPVTAAVGNFDETVHPRGRDGRFIKKFGIVKWLANGLWAYGKVVGIEKDPDVNGGALITVQPSNLAGKLLGGSNTATVLKQNQVYTAPVAKAHLSTAGLTPTTGPLGSNPGGMYDIPTLDGPKKFYVKTAKSKDHGRNEMLANLLYSDAGVAVPTVTYKEDDNKIYSPVTKGKHDMADRLKDKDEAWIDSVRRNYVVDAWLANHDVFGLTMDNIKSDEGGTAWRIDNGGAMLFRAQGGTKSGFGDTVPELDSMAMYDKTGIYSGTGVTMEQKLDGAQRILAISPEQIKDRVASVNLPKSLADKMIARRAYIANYFGLPLPETYQHPDTDETTDAPLFDPADLVEGHGKSRDWFPMPLSVGALVLAIGDTVEFPDGTQQTYGLAAGMTLSAIDRANQVIGWQNDHGQNAEILVKTPEGSAGRPPHSKFGQPAGVLSSFTWQRGDRISRVNGDQYEVLHVNQYNGGILVRPVTGETEQNGLPFIIDSNFEGDQGAAFSIQRWDPPKAGMVSTEAADGTADKAIADAVETNVNQAIDSEAEIETAHEVEEPGWEAKVDAKANLGPVAVQLPEADLEDWEKDLLAESDNALAGPLGDQVIAELFKPPLAAPGLYQGLDVDALNKVATGEADWVENNYTYMLPNSDAYAIFAVNALASPESKAVKSEQKKLKTAVTKAKNAAKKQTPANRVLHYVNYYNTVVGYIAQAKKNLEDAQKNGSSSQIQAQFKALDDQVKGLAYAKAKIVEQGGDFDALIPDPYVDDKKPTAVEAMQGLSQSVGMAAQAMEELKKALDTPLPAGDNKPAESKTVAQLGDKEMILGDGTLAKPGSKLVDKQGNEYEYIKAKGPYAVLVNPAGGNPVQKKASLLGQPDKTPVTVEKKTPTSANGKIPQLGQLAEAPDGHKGKITMISPDGTFVYITDESGVKKRKSTGKVTILNEDAPTLEAPLAAETVDPDTTSTTDLFSLAQILAMAKTGDKVKLTNEGADDEWLDVVKEFSGEIYLPQIDVNLSTVVEGNTKFTFNYDPSPIEFDNSPDTIDDAATDFADVPPPTGISKETFEKLAVGDTIWTPNGSKLIVVSKPVFPAKVIVPVLTEEGDVIPFHFHSVKQDQVYPLGVNPDQVSLNTQQYADFTAITEAAWHTGVPKGLKPINPLSGQMYFQPGNNYTNVFDAAKKAGIDTTEHPWLHYDLNTGDYWDLTDLTAKKWDGGLGVWVPTDVPAESMTVDTKPPSVPAFGVQVPLMPDVKLPDSDEDVTTPDDDYNPDDYNGYQKQPGDHIKAFYFEGDQEINENTWVFVKPEGDSKWHTYYEEDGALNPNGLTNEPEQLVVGFNIINGVNHGDYVLAHEWKDGALAKVVNPGLANSKIIDDDLLNKVPDYYPVKPGQIIAVLQANIDDEPSFFVPNLTDPDKWDYVGSNSNIGVVSGYYTTAQLANVGSGGEETLTYYKVPDTHSPLPKDLPFTPEPGLHIRKVQIAGGGSVWFVSKDGVGWHYVNNGIYDLDAIPQWTLPELTKDQNDHGYSTLNEWQVPGPAPIFELPDGAPPIQVEPGMKIVKSQTSGNVAVTQWFVSKDGGENWNWVWPSDGSYDENNTWTTEQISDPDAGYGFSITQQWEVPDPDAAPAPAPAFQYPAGMPVINITPGMKIKKILVSSGSGNAVFYVSTDNGAHWSRVLTGGTVATTEWDLATLEKNSTLLEEWTVPDDILGDVESMPNPDDVVVNNPGVPFKTIPGLYIRIMETKFGKQFYFISKDNQKWTVPGAVEDAAELREYDVAAELSKVTAGTGFTTNDLDGGAYEYKLISQWQVPVQEAPATYTGKTWKSPLGGVVFKEMSDGTWMQEGLSHIPITTQGLKAAWGWTVGNASNKADTEFEADFNAPASFNGFYPKEGDVVLTVGGEGDNPQPIYWIKSDAVGGGDKWYPIESSGEFSTQNVIDDEAVKWTLENIQTSSIAYGAFNAAPADPPIATDAPAGGSIPLKDVDFTFPYIGSAAVAHNTLDNLGALPEGHTIWQAANGSVYIKSNTGEIHYVYTDGSIGDGNYTNDHDLQTAQQIKIKTTAPPVVNTAVSPDDDLTTSTFTFPYPDKESVSKTLISKIKPESFPPGAQIWQHSSGALWVKHSGSGKTFMVTETGDVFESAMVTNAKLVLIAPAGAQIPAPSAPSQVLDLTKITKATYQGGGDVSSWVTNKLHGLGKLHEGQSIWGIPGTGAVFLKKEDGSFWIITINGQITPGDAESTASAVASGNLKMIDLNIPVAESQASVSIPTEFSDFVTDIGAPLGILNPAQAATITATLGKFKKYAEATHALTEFDKVYFSIYGNIVLGNSATQDYYVINQTEGKPSLYQSGDVPTGFTEVFAKPKYADGGNIDDSFAVAKLIKAKALGDEFWVPAESPNVVWVKDSKNEGSWKIWHFNDDSVETAEDVFTPTDLSSFKQVIFPLPGIGIPGAVKAAPAAPPKTEHQLLVEKANELGAPLPSALKKIEADKVITIPEGSWGLIDGTYVNLKAGTYKSHDMLEASNGAFFPASAMFVSPEFITDDESKFWLGQKPATPEAVSSWGGPVTKDGHIPKMGMFVKKGVKAGKIIGISKDKSKVTVLLPDGKTSTLSVIGITTDFSANYTTYAPKKEPVKLSAGMPLAIDTVDEALSKTIVDGKWRALLPGQDGIRNGEMVVTSATTPSGKHVNRVIFALTKQARLDLMATLSTEKAEKKTGGFDHVGRTAEQLQLGDKLAMRYSEYSKEWKTDKSPQSAPTHTIKAIEEEENRYKVTLVDDSSGEISSFFLKNYTNGNVLVYTWNPDKPVPVHSNTAFQLSEAAKADGWKMTGLEDRIFGAIKGGFAGKGVLDVEPGQPVPEGKAAFPVGPGGNKSGKGAWNPPGIRLISPDGVVIEVSSLDASNHSYKGQVVVTLPQGAGADVLNSALDRLGVAHKPLTQEKAKFLALTLMSSMTSNNISSIDAPNIPEAEIWKNINFAFSTPAHPMNDIGWQDIRLSVDESNGKLTFYWSERVIEQLHKISKQKVIYRGAPMGSNHQNNVDHVVSTVLHGTANGVNKRLGGLVHLPTSAAAGGFSPASDAPNNAGHGGFLSSTPTDTLYSSNSNASYAGSAMMVYHRAEAIFGRLIDFRGANGDAFGSGAGYGTNSLKSFLLDSQVKVDIVVNGGIPAESVGLVAVADATIRNDAIAKLKAMGIHEVNGTPIEKFVVSKSSLSGKSAEATLNKVFYPPNMRPILDIPIAYTAEADTEEKAA